MLNHEKIIIQLLCEAWRVNSAVAERVLSKFPFADRMKVIGEEELNRLKSADPNKLETILKKYRHTKDPFEGRLNIMFPAWFTAYRATLGIKAGDCDDSAALMQEVRPGGRIWAIVEHLQNTDAAGHVIYQDPKNFIWSDFRLDDEASDIRDVCRKYVKKWRFAIEILPGVKLGEVIER